MRLSFFLVCLVQLLSVVLVVTEETIENKEYNVSVAFSQNVPSENGMEIIEKMKITLQEASETLYNAIGLRFTRVTLEIPESWNTEGWNITVEESYSSDHFNGDILIDDTNNTAFGKFPSAQQYGGCGIPSHQITVPTAFFDDLNEFPKGISLAREWLKYQYGVFDENGYFEDPQYPMYYHIPGSNASEVHVTDCTNSEIAYNFKDQNGKVCQSDKISINKLNSGECALQINEEDVENVTSSFMYFQQDISNMTHVCGKDDDHQHNSRSPNKQNVLCYGKSIWDVIPKSKDSENEDAKKEYVAPEFVFFKKGMPRVVVAWENTGKFASKGKIILNAIRKLMIGLPDGSMFRAFPFKDSVANEDYPLQSLDGKETKTGIAAGIKYDFAASGDGNYKDAIAKAFKISKNFAEPMAGNIIVITGTAEDLYVILLEDLDVCSQRFAISERSTLEDLEKLVSGLPCLEVVRIPMSDEDEKMYEKLTGILERISPSKVDDKITEMMDIDYLSNNTCLEVQVDDLTEKVTFWVFSDKEGGYFHLKLNGEDIKEERKNDDYGNILKISYLPKEAGTVDFSFQHPHKTDPILAEIQKTSKAGKYFTGKVTVHDTTSEEDSHQMPVIVYAIVRFGSYPVQNAQVSALIKAPDGQESELVLIDNGKGDPDITRNDGVYSRYFTNFTNEGTYTVTVSVNSQGYGTRYGVDENAGYRTCCGSNLNEDKSLMNGGTPIGIEFTKEFETIFTAKSGPPEDGYKPSRITDLRIAEVTTDGILLKWTAPGGEADAGTASSYEIKLFCGEGKKTECNTQEAIQVVDKPLPLNYSIEQQLKIKIMIKTEALSIGILAINEKNKMGDLSNIIEIQRSSGTLPEITSEEPEAKAAKSSTTGIIVGCVIAGIVIIICIVGVVVYFKKREQKKDTEIGNVEANKDFYEVTGKKAKSEK